MTAAPPLPDTETVPPSDAAKPGDPFVEVTVRIRELTNSEVPEAEFFPRWIANLSRLPGIASGTVWGLNANGLLSVLCEHGVDRATGGDARAYHARVEHVLGVLRTGEPTVRDADSSGLPTAIVAPVRNGERIGGAVELSLDAGVSDGDRLVLLESIDDAATLASRYLEWRAAEGTPKAESEFWNQAQETIVALHAGRTSRAVAVVAANDGRSLLGCDRVTIAVTHGSRTEVVAITGQARINPRSNQVRALSKLAALAVRTGATIDFTGEMPDLPREALEALMRYLAEHDVGGLSIVPLHAARDREVTQDAARPRPPRCVGAMIVERSAGATLSPPLQRRMGRLAEHVGVALDNAGHNERVLLHGLRSAVGRTMASLSGRRLLTVSCVSAVVVTLGLLLAFVPWTYRVEATGQLLPVVQREVFAPATGRVAETFVVTGDWVDEGAPLLRLQDDERDLEWVDLKTKLDEKLESERTIEAELDDPRSGRSREEEIRLRGQLRQTGVEIRGLRERLKLIEAELALLTITAPRAGTVTTSDVPDSLRRRPVQRGDALVELMDDRSDWQLEIEIPEDRFGHVLAARSAAGNTPVPVEFVLSTQPEERYQGRLVSLSTRTGLSGEHGSSVRGIVEVVAADLPERRIGTHVVARLDCGERCLGYVLFGDFVDWVQRWVW